MRATSRSCRRRCEGDIHRSNWAEVEKRSRQFAQALRGAGRRARRARRHAGLERPPPRRDLLRRVRLGPRLPHHQPAPVPRADRVDRQRRRGRGAVLRRRPAAAGREARAEAEDGAPLRADGPPRPDARDHRHPRPAVLRRPARAARRRATQWPELDEDTAATLCYTSGTTGNPKGALYSHRSIVLHSYGAALPDAMNCSTRDVILPIVPMFHVNAWGIPYTAAMIGAKLVMPGAVARRRVAVQAVRDREGHLQRRRAHRVAGPAELHEGQRPALQHLQAHRHRRLGLPAGDDEVAAGGVRRRGDPRLGHDRAVAAGHAVQAAVQARGAAGRARSRSCCRARAA